MIVEVYPVCMRCKHLKETNNRLECEAFNVIPLEIWQAENNHGKPLDGQENNTVFEPLDNATQ